MAVSKVSDDARDDRYEVRLYNPLGGRYRKVVHGKRAAERHEVLGRTGRRPDPAEGRLRSGAKRP